MIFLMVTSWQPTLNCYQMFSDIQTQKMAKLVLVRMLLVNEKGESGVQGMFLVLSTAPGSLLLLLPVFCHKSLGKIMRTGDDAPM